MQKYRDASFQPADWLRSLRRALYLMATYPAFNETLYGLVYWLQEKTHLLNRLTKAYHLDEKIHFPPDFLQQMSKSEGRVGLVQLKNIPISRNVEGKWPHIILSIWMRRPHGSCHLRLRAPPIHIFGAGQQRDKILAIAAHSGVQFGQLIEYSLPHLAPYHSYANMNAFPNSLYCSQHMINLPIHPGMDKAQQDKVIELVKEIKAVNNPNI